MYQPCTSTTVNYGQRLLAVAPRPGRYPIARACRDPRAGAPGTTPALAVPHQLLTLPKGQRRPVTNIITKPQQAERLVSPHVCGRWPPRGVATGFTVPVADVATRSLVHGLVGLGVSLPCPLPWWIRGWPR
jgi:hypothetical protein